MKKKAEKYLSSLPKDSFVGKHVYITGGNSGIGFGLAKNLLSLGAVIHLLCRNPKKAEEAKKSLLEMFPGAEIYLHPLDLSSFQSIFSCVEELSSSPFPIDYFVHNAGVFRMEKVLSVDGYDLTLGTNLIGTVLLNESLIPLFASQAHKPVVLFTSSLSASWSKISCDSLFHPYPKSKIGLYAESKRGIYLYGRYCQRQEDLPFLPVLAHPGVTFTPLFLKGYPKAFASFLSPLFQTIFHSPDEASLIDVEALLHPSVDGYFSPKGCLSASGLPKKKKFPKKLEKSDSSFVPSLLRELKSKKELS